MLLLVHGGAAAVATKLLEQKLSDLRKSAKAGFVVLLKKNANKDNVHLDSVQQAVQYMEDSPYFNAGYGSSLTSTGQVEMDAIIADGKSINFGAISAVTSFKNPILVARSILDNSEHCLYTADGAHQFGLQQGINLIDRDSLVHQFAKDRLDEFKTFHNAIMCDHEQVKNESSDHDTVGSVALDQFGNVAAATSTGGITGKQPGRVGDTPVIGSGAYADNTLGAVSTTGHGEAIMRVCLAREVLYRYKENLTRQKPNPNWNAMQDAVDQSLQMMKDRIDGYGGVIAVGLEHDIGIGFTTVAMPWAYINSEDIDQTTINELNEGNDPQIKIHYGYHPGEHLIAFE